MRLNVILTGIAVCAAAVALLAACGDSDGGDPSPTPTPSPDASATPGPGVTETEIILGMTNDLSGAGGTPYAAVTNAVAAYFAAINEELGGVCGRDLVLRTADDEYTPEIALEQAQRLVEEEEVLAMIGGQSTEAHLLVARYLNDPDNNPLTERGVPDLFVSTGWSGWGNVEQYPWTFGFIPDYAADGEVIASHINLEHAGANVALLYEDTPFGIDYREAIEATLDEGMLVASVSYARPAAPSPTPADGESGEQEAELDVAGLVGRIIDAEADVVILASPPDVTARVYHAAADEEFGPQFVLSYINAPSALAAEIGGGTSADALLAGFEALSGTVTTQYLRNLVEDHGHPALVEHERIMETHDGPPPSTLSIYGQTLAETVVETISRACDNLTREGVRAAAESIRGFQPSLLLPGIEIELGPDDHRAIEALQPVRIEEDGTLTSLGDPIRARG